MLATRLSQFLCDSKKFSKGISEYVETMHQSGHVGKPKYADIHGSKKKKKRKETSRGLTHPLASTPKPTSARNSCDCLLNTFLPITDCTKSATNSMSK